MWRLSIFSMLFLLWSTQSLEAQEQVTIGTRVRITAPSVRTESIVGDVTSISGDTIVVVTKKGSRRRRVVSPAGVSHFSTEILSRVVDGVSPERMNKDRIVG